MGPEVAPAVSPGDYKGPSHSLTYAIKFGVEPEVAKSNLSAFASKYADLMGATPREALKHMNAEGLGQQYVEHCASFVSVQDHRRDDPIRTTRDDVEVAPTRAGAEVGARADVGAESPDEGFKLGGGAKEFSHIGSRSLHMRALVEDDDDVSDPDAADGSDSASVSDVEEESDEEDSFVRIPTPNPRKTMILSSPRRISRTRTETYRTGPLTAMRKGRKSGATRCTARCPCTNTCRRRRRPSRGGTAGAHLGQRRRPRRGETRANICDGRGRSGKTATQREPHSGRFRPRAVDNDAGG